MRSRFRSADRRLLRCLPACGALMMAAALGAKAPEAQAQEAPPHSAELDRMIVEQAKKNNVPESLVRRIVMRESKYDPAARNHKYWGLMQISYPTAKSMGFKGSPSDLLNPLVNLTYAVPYLANAFIIAGKREDEAIRLYASGYYFTARRRGLLGALHGADGTPEETQVATAEQAPAQVGVYGSLPQSPQMASATPAPAEPPSAMDLEASKDAVALVADKDGTMRPPKKWRRDGGVTEIARGVQGVENVAAYAGAKNETASHKSARRSRKTTEFASIDMPASAQAYAADASQDPRFAQAASQTAIAQATGEPQRPSAFYAQGTVGEAPQASTQQPSTQQVPDAAQTASADPANAAAPVTPADEPTTKHVRERSAHRNRHHSHEDETTQVAKAGSAVAKVGTVAEDGAKASRRHIAHHGASKTTPVLEAEQHDDRAARDAPSLRP